MARSTLKILFRIQRLFAAVQHHDIAFVPAFLRTHPDDLTCSATKFRKEALENLAEKDSILSAPVK
jgi:hypothetical protein